jgi:hypothetical protein
MRRAPASTRPKVRCVGFSTGNSRDDGGLPDTHPHAPDLRTIVVFVIAAAALAAAQDGRKGPSVWRLPSGEHHEGRLSRRAKETVIVTAIGALVLDRPNGAVPFDARADAALIDDAALGLHPKFTGRSRRRRRPPRPPSVCGRKSKNISRPRSRSIPFTWTAARSRDRSDAVFELADEDVDEFGASKRVEALFMRAQGSALGAAMLEGRIGDFDADLRLRFGLRFLKRGDAHQRLLAARVLADCTDATERVKPSTKPACSIRRTRCAAPLRRRSDAREIPRSRASSDAPFRVRIRRCALRRSKRWPKWVFAKGLPISSGRSPAKHPFRRRTSPSRATTATVGDYDVEVAAGAVIAKPITSLVHEGVVLEASILSTTEERVRIVGALRRLTGLDLPPDAKAWKTAVGL